MAEAVYWYGKAFTKAFNKEIDYDSDTIKIALFTNAHAPSQDDDYYDGAHGMTEVASGTGYTTGGETLASKAITYTDGTKVFAIDAADVVWTFTGTKVARWACIYDSTPASNKPFICYIDFGADKTVTDAGTLTVTFNASGIAKTTITAQA
jgi:hypothetical protein